MAANTGLIPAITALIQSPGITKYVIGITADIPSRVRAYSRVSIPWVYVLQTNLFAKQALAIEKALFEAAVSDRRSLAYRKYHDGKKEQKYCPSIGGVGAERPGKAYAVYVAGWFE